MESLCIMPLRISIDAKVRFLSHSNNGLFSFLPMQSTCSECLPTGHCKKQGFNFNRKGSKSEREGCQLKKKLARMIVTGTFANFATHNHNL